MIKPVVFLSALMIGLGITGNWYVQWRDLTKPDNLVEDSIGRIPMLDNPDFESKTQAQAWLTPYDEVIGVTVDGRARAYPTKILQYHELVSDVVGQTPLVVWYYPPTGGIAVYSRLYRDVTTHTERTLQLTLTNLIGFDGPIALDRTTRFRWNLDGEPFENPTSRRLAIIPFGRYSWQKWQTIFPETTALTIPNNYSFDYSKHPTLFGSSITLPVAKIQGRGKVDASYSQPR